MPKFEIMNRETDPGAMKQTIDAKRYDALLDLLGPLSIGQEGGEIVSALKSYVANLPSEIKGSMDADTLRMTLLAQAKKFAQASDKAFTEQDAQAFDESFLRFLQTRAERKAQDRLPRRRAA